MLSSLRSRPPQFADDGLSRMTYARSHTATISASSELIISTAAPSATSVSMRLKISALAPTSMPRVGSSKMKRRDPAVSHLPMTTFC